MKKLYVTISALFIFLLTAGAQSFDWIRHNPVGWTLNPSMPSHTSCISANGNVYAGRMVVSVQNFGQDIFGHTSIDCYTSGGTLQWSYLMDHQAVIHKMAADASGNVYIGGSFMETLHLNGADSLVNTGSGFDVNVFLIALDASGNLLWKRNLTAGNSNIFRIEALGIDPQSNFWYACMDLFDSEIVRTDANGLDVQTVSIFDNRSIGGICFDPSGNIFVSGSTELGTMTVGGLSVNVPESYMMFVAKIDNGGQGLWCEVAHDVTFQSPVIISDGSGGAYVGGTLMDATTFGTVSFDGVQWVYDVFLTHVDANGNFSWGVEVPFQSTLTGDFERGAGDFLTTDGAGTVYMMGTTRGIVDWGNGVVTGTSAIPSPIRGIAVIAFDANGIPQWRLEGGNSTFDMAYTITANTTGEAWFTAAVMDSAVFGSTVFMAPGIEFVVGKINTLSSSVSDIDPPAGLTVYPVPATDMLIVRGNVDASESFTVLNCLSERLAVPAERSSGEIRFDISRLPAGYYIIRLGKNRHPFIVAE